MRKPLRNNGKIINYIPVLHAYILFLRLKKMIQYWQQNDGVLTRTAKDKIDTAKNTWVDARDVTRADITELEDDYKIEHDHMLDILDPDELSRIEDGDTYILTIERLPIYEPSSEIPYFTIPAGIIIKGKFIITICWTDCEVLKDFSSGRVKGLSLSDFPAFIIRILSRADITFLRYLKEINRRCIGIQKELQKSIENKEIIQLLNMEKSLEFFTTSLANNQLLLEKIRKTKLLSIDDEDQDWLDDVEIDNRQAIVMADTYSNILAGMIDAFASVISNNLNIVMRRLTVINLVIMVPTFITSFMGMNIKLPFMEDSWIGVIIISAVCIVSTAVATYILGDHSTMNQLKKRDAKNAAGKKHRHPVPESI